MVRYSNSRVYKIYSESSPELIFIGSTTEKDLTRVLNNKKGAFNRWVNDMIDAYNPSYDIFIEGEAKIELIEEFPHCKSKKELREYENQYIERVDCVNKKEGNRISER